MGKEYDKLFVGGDLSGIQKFLYNIPSAKAAASLRGRSAYLREVMNSLCHDIEKAVKEAGAQTVKTLYCSGGKFYLLTDNSDEITKAIDRIATKARQDLWEKHLGLLGINVSYVSFHENDDKTINSNGQNNMKPGYLWELVNNDFTKQKNQKFKSIIGDNYQQLFEPIAVTDKSKVCAVTGIESDKCVKIQSENEADDFYVLPSVAELIRSGQRLGAEENAKDFNYYAHDSYLGILRMDIDGLGKRFYDGFKSIEEYCVFSERLTTFFEETIPDIQKKYFRDTLTIIYAGGDDLFAVGHWNETIHFAEKVQQTLHAEFSEDNISISGGIVVVRQKFPIAKAAEMAGKAEDVAKDFNNGEKNAITILGSTVSWKEEFDYVKKYKEKFVELIHNKKLDKALLHYLMLFAATNNQNIIQQKAEYPKVWHLSYYLTRCMQRLDEKEDEGRNLCKKLRDEELNYKNQRNFEKIALAARWAELKLRDKE